MSLKEAITMLVNVVDRGGNMLLNVGPDPDGVIPATHVARLQEIGGWLEKNGESIYGTRPGPFEPLDRVYGSTQKGKNIYIHLLTLATGSTDLKLPAINQKLLSCKLINGEKIKFNQDKTGITLSIDSKQLDPVVTTLVLKTK